MSVSRLPLIGTATPSGDPDILVIFDAGYEPARLTWLLRDLPVQVLGRLGSNRVLRQAPPPRRPGQAGAPVRHGAELRLCDEAAHPGPDVTTSTQTSRYGTAIARAWHRMHPRLTHRGAWAARQGKLPVIEGTLIKLTVDHLPHERDPQAGVAVDLTPRRGPRRDRPVLAGVPAAV